MRRLLSLGFLVALALGPRQAQAAIAFVGAADLGDNGGSGALSVNYTVGSGSDRLLVVTIAGGAVGTDADDITSVTYNSVSMTLADKSSVAGGRYVYQYYLLNPASGSNTVSIIASSNHYLLAGVSEYTGVGGLDNHATSNTNTLSLTTIADNCWIVTSVPQYSSGAGAGWTLEAHDGTFSSWYIFDEGPIHPAASTTFGPYTTLGPPASVVVASYSPAGAALPSSSNRALLGVGK
jgi:hypothetical protein